MKNRKKIASFLTFIFFSFLSGFLFFLGCLYFYDRQTSLKVSDLLYSPVLLEKHLFVLPEDRKHTFIFDRIEFSSYEGTFKPYLIDLETYETFYQKNRSIKSVLEDQLNRTPLTSEIKFFLKHPRQEKGKGDRVLQKILFFGDGSFFAITFSNDAENKLFFYEKQANNVFFHEKRI